MKVGGWRCERGPRTLPSSLLFTFFHSLSSLLSPTSNANTFSHSLSLSPIPSPVLSPSLLFSPSRSLPLSCSLPLARSHSLALSLPLALSFPLALSSVLLSSALLSPACSQLPTPYLPHRSSLFMMQTCSGSSKDPSPCTCSSFTPKPPPKENKCSSCGHRQSAHNDRAPNKYVKRLLKNIATTAVHEEARKETVQGFRPQHSSTATSVRIFPLQVLSTSILFCLLDYLKGKGKGKTTTRRASQRITSSSSGHIKIGRIIVFPCGSEVRISSLISVVFFIANTHDLNLMAPPSEFE